MEGGTGPVRLTLVQDAGRWGRYTQSYCDTTYVGRVFTLHLGERTLLVRTLRTQVREGGQQVVLEVQVVAGVVDNEDGIR